MVLLPMVFIAWRWRVYPTTRWAIPLSFIIVMSGLVLLYRDWLFVVTILDVVFLILMIGDLAFLAGRCPIEIERVMQRAASLGKGHRVTLVVQNPSHKRFRIDVMDDIPDEVTADPPMHSLTIGSRKRAEVEHVLRATRRGAYSMEHVYLRVFSRLGLWVRFVQRKCPGQLHVYPDMKQLAEYAILARTDRLSLIGVRRTRRLGQDNNFERLRDYTPDDNYKHIDWRSTARRQKLTVKQFQSDQSQRVFFMLDCGRMMTNQYEGLSLLDYALNSILMLSYVALRQGDSVGMICFSDTIHDFVPLRGGSSQMNRILHAGFDRFPRPVQSRFDQAFLHLSMHCRRRAMVVLVTNVIDDVSAGQITGYLSNLGGRHLPVLALLRDHRMFDAADNPSMEDEVLYRSAGAAQILSWRHDVLRRMMRDSVLVVDAFPEDLTSPLVNQYLEAKAKHLL